MYNSKRNTVNNKSQSSLRSYKSKDVSSRGQVTSRMREGEEDVGEILLYPVLPEQTIQVLFAS